MNENQDSEIEQLIDSISKVNFISGKRDTNQYVFPIQRILRQAGFKTITEYLTTYPEGDSKYWGKIDLYAKRGKTVICVEVDYKTVKKASTVKISRIWKAIPVFVLAYEGKANIKESLERIHLPNFFLIDLYNHRVFFSERQEVVTPMTILYVSYRSFVRYDKYWASFSPISTF